MPGYSTERTKKSSSRLHSVTFRCTETKWFYNEQETQTFDIPFQKCFAALKILPILENDYLAQRNVFRGLTD